MPRIRVDGYPIGCPAVHGEGYCPFCGGGWPGTKSPSAVLIKAAKKGGLNPVRLGCGTLEEQGKFLVAHFSRNGKGVREINLRPEDENDCGIGPVGGGIYGPALMELITEDLGMKGSLRDSSEELAVLRELPVGPVVILAVDAW